MQFSSSPSIGLRCRPACLVAAALVIAAVLPLSGCRDKTPVIISQFKAFGVQVDVSLVGVGREQARQATSIVATDFALLQRDLTESDEGPLARVNRLLADGEPFIAPPSLLPLVRLCQTYEEQSEGLFNPAIGRVLDLWEFDYDRLGGHPPPTGESIARVIRAEPSLSQVEIRGLTMRGSNPAVKLDFGQIARGYVVDHAMQHLIDLGVRNALIQAGDELRAIGDRSGQPWRIPIRRPSGSGVFAIIAIRGDESIVTTAEYSRNFVFKGRLYHAVIDPRTGWPAAQIRSATVVHRDAAGAAAAATALFVAGPQDWHRIAERMGIRYALLIDSAGRAHMTQAMADRIEMVDTDTEVLLPGETAGRPLAAEAPL